MGRFNSRYVDILGHVASIDISDVVYELCNLSDRLDRIMGVDEDGGYWNLENVVRSNKEVRDSVNKITNISGDPDHYYNIDSLIKNMNAINDRMKDIENKVSKITKISGDDGHYRNLDNIWHKLDQIEKKLDELGVD